MRHFLAFDIETAKVLPAGVTEILAYRPLGIACAVAVASDFPKPKVWHGSEKSGRPSARMSSEEAGALLYELKVFVHEGYTLVTWGGLELDLDVLGEESGLAKEAAVLASSHVDMLFHAICSLGHRISLQNAAMGMGLSGKKRGITGADAPAMWAAGRHKEVIEYCTQDARIVLQLAEACEKRRQLAWVKQSGKIAQMPLPQGWLTVQEARRLPLPDTSWMSDPPSRSRLLSWVDKACTRNS